MGYAQRHRPGVLGLRSDCGDGADTRPSDDMTGTHRLGVVCALTACVIASAAAVPRPADARDGGDRAEARVEGVCGRASTASLRLRAEDGRIRVDMHVDTSKLGLWRVTVLHERRRVGEVKTARATRSEGGFEYRIVLPDFAGPDAVWVRAVAPRGETCSAGTTVSDT